MRQTARISGPQRKVPAIVLGTTLLWPICAIAETTPPATAPAAEQAAPRAVEASVGHAAAKAVTLKAATFSTGTIIYALGTGSVYAGGVLSAINAAGSFVIYTANDYLWDYYSPNTNVSANNETFHATSSLSRNTLKYLTFKPAVTVLNVGTIYWFTETATAMAATSTAAIVALPAMFYLNNTLWDWYDWHSVAKDTVPAAK